MSDFVPVYIRITDLKFENELDNPQTALQLRVSNIVKLIGQCMYVCQSLHAVGGVRRYEQLPVTLCILTSALLSGLTVESYR
jgi:hypothetical protein